MHDPVVLIGVQGLPHRPWRAQRFCLHARLLEKAKQGPSSQFAERAGGGLEACSSSKKLRGQGLRAQTRKVKSRVLPHVARRGAAHRSSMQGPSKRAFYHSAPLPIPFTVPYTFTSCGWRPCSQAPMSLLGPQRLGKLVLSYCPLSWAGQRAPICLLNTTCRSLNGHVAPALVASLLASFEALRERIGNSNVWWGSSKDQAAPEGPRLLCRALRPTKEAPHVFKHPRRLHTSCFVPGEY